MTENERLLQVAQDNAVLRRIRSELGYRCGQRVERPAVLAADGEPLEVGQTVYAMHYGYVKCTILAIERVVDGYLVEVENEDGHKFRQTPDELTHQRPVLDVDGVPIHEGDTVYYIGDTIYADGTVLSGTVKKVGPGIYVAVDFDRIVGAYGETIATVPRNTLTHIKPEPPDSWEKVKEDARRYDEQIDASLVNPVGCEITASDLVRRCKALSERKGQ